METCLTEYVKNGIIFDPAKQELTIDLNQVRVIRVKAINERERIEKFYVLKVSPSSLCLF